ncbi:MAG: hypothetical protein QOJ98_3464 [Acidobacteriota bacterium]|nr:hypothetical protein [Acidobacteriota bacterium]
MEPCIRQWHTRYRAAGGGGTSVARFERDVRPRAADAYTGALEAAFGHDRAVYVLRRLRVGLTVVNPSVADDAVIARRWGVSAVAAAARLISRHSDDTSLVMRFESEAAFVARFLADLLDGVAWDRWYYAPFARYRGRTFSHAVRDALVDSREVLPEILRELTRAGCLRGIVAHLSTEIARELWDDVIAPAREAPTAENFRVFVRTAMAIVDAVARWECVRPSEDELLARYFATVPERPAWTRPSELAQAVLAVLSFLRARGLVRTAHDADETVVCAAIAPFEWLDREWLAASVALVETTAIPVGVLLDPLSSEVQRLVVRAALSIAKGLSLWCGEPPAEETVLALCAALEIPAADAPRELARAVLAVLVLLRERGLVHARTGEARVRVGEVVESMSWLERAWLAPALGSWLEDAGVAPATPVAPRRSNLTGLQTRILTLLGELLRTGDLVLPDQALESHRNAVAAFAAIVTAESSLAEHPATAYSIAWVLQRIARETRAEPSPSAEGVAAVIDRILGQASPTIAIPVEGRLVESRFAGVFLLSRALIDARVPQLAAALGAEPFAGVLQFLASAWTGEADPDEGLLFWSGADEACPAPPCDALAAAVERVVQDRAAFAPSLKAEPDLPSNIVRLWAQWLRGLAHSSVPWLLRQFILRRGTIRIEGSLIAVSLAPAPLDAVLELSHYLDPIAAVPWLGDARITFAIDRSLT